MPRPFRRLTLDEFADLLARFPFTRRVNAVHMHHTWRPRVRDYTGRETIEGMWRYHTQELGWSDIAQHITIAPDGSIWTGRGWNEPPASASGHNGNRSAGPFMFEMIGDFDAGRDPFRAPQRDTALKVIARVQARFNLPVESLRFHNQMSQKSCPGSAISFADTLEAVREMRERLERNAGLRRDAYASPFPAEALAYREKTDGVIRLLSDSAARTSDPPDAEPPEDNESYGEEREAYEPRATSRDPYKQLADATYDDEERTFEERDDEALNLWHKIATDDATETPSDKDGWKSIDGSPAKTAAAFSNGGAAGRRRALCVGINNYPTSPLSGCVADARQWAGEFTRMGFETSLLLDARATREAILSALSDLIRTSRAGDVVVFQYAGHGTTVRDVSGDEVTGHNSDDEALCPYDFASGALIIDDDIAEVFGKIPDGVNLTCFFDCCHSGTISRFGVGVSPLNRAREADERPRFIQATPELLRAHAEFRRRIGSRGVTGRRGGPEMMREVVFAACLDSEVALESDGHGHFTSIAAGLLRSASEAMTNEEFAARVTEGFGTTPRQHPELDCAPRARSQSFLRPLGADGSKAQPKPAPVSHAAKPGSNSHPPLNVSAVADRLRSLASELEGYK
ncbi:MAG: caspase family protein [Pyrinomonadaceae bacterium]|nr:caspase family protein [Pyrinomonadaceae bacterium]